MRKIASVVAVVLTAFGLAACSSSGKPSSSGGSKNIKIAAINLLTFSPVYVAKELGYFKQEGLNVTIVQSQSGAASVQAMLGRSVQAATAGFDTPVTLTKQGQQVQSLVGMEMETIYAFVGGSSFPQVPADDPKAFAGAVKGKKFGVASAGSTGDVIARGLFKEYGLNPDKDVNIIPVGTGAAASAALKSGGVDALISYEPDLTQITSSGAGRIVFDLRTTKTEKKYSQLPTSTLEATTSWIKSNPDTATALVRAVAKADKVLRTQPTVALSTLKKLYPDLSAAQVTSIYKTSQSHFRPQIPQSVYNSALSIYKESGLVTSDVAYDKVVATKFTADWSA
jgi:NitT/TauT family transport system substrate-binding protein